MTLGAAKPDGVRSRGREKQCPKCGASPGEMCVTSMGRERVSNHRERHTGKAPVKPMEVHVPKKKQPGLRVVGKQEGPSRIEQYIQTAAQEEAVRFEEYCYHYLQWCESPIEELLTAALYAASKVSDASLWFMGKRDSLPGEPFEDQTAYVYQQVPVGPYRVDLLIQDATLPAEIGPWRFMVVECDGHDFHEKTKQQARRDKQRDRFLQSRGFKVLRFTGSEIWEDPDKCADEIISELARDDDWRNRPVKK